MHPTPPSAASMVPETSASNPPSFPSPDESVVVGRKNNDRWSEMPPDLLEDISDRLPLCDFISFRSVCKLWRSSPSARSEITRFPKDGPWLMFYDGFYRRDDDGGVCYMYCHPYPNRCIFRLPDLRGATVKQSKSGWLFAHRNEHFFLYNPFTLVMIDLPNHNVCREQECTMTTLPTAVDSAVFIVSRKDGSKLEISSCCIGDTQWNRDTVLLIKDEIGTLTASFYYKNNIVIIFGSENRTVFIVIYDHVREVVAGFRPLESGIMNMRKFGWEEDLQDKIHAEDWLRVFGEKGVNISTCPVSTTEAAAPARNHVVAGDVGSAEEFKLVKATWIEPIFA